VIIKYRTKKYACREGHIVAVEVERETGKSVWVKEKNWNGEMVIGRNARHSDWSQYHDTWAEARAYLLAGAVRVNEALETRLRKSEDYLVEINTLVEPE